MLEGFAGCNARFLSLLSINIVDYGSFFSVNIVD